MVHFRHVKHGSGKKKETFFTLEIKNNPSLQQNSTVSKFRNFSVENLIWNLIWKPRSEDNFLKPWDPLTECNYDQSFSFYTYTNACMSSLNAIWKALQTFTHIKTHRKYTNLANVGRMNGRKTWNLEWQTQFDEKPKPISVHWKDRKISSADSQNPQTFLWGRSLFSCSPLLNFTRIAWSLLVLTLRIVCF